MALLNLAVNARDAMPGGGDITVATREETVRHESQGLKPGSYICLSVRDSGSGMDEATLARAMEPFFTTKGVGKGTGLGLSMVHGMAQQIGGAFTLKSKPGEGTTAELRLPIAVGLVAAEPLSIVRVPDEPIVEALALTVIAVDDDVLVLTNTVAMLEDLGHTALAAASGEEALQILRQQDNIDLVITDQAMPSMTGAQLAEIIRDERPGLPIILATGFAELEPGFAAELPRLAKPFNELDLAKEIARVFPPHRDAGGNVVAFRSGAGK